MIGKRINTVRGPPIQAKQTSISKYFMSSDTSRKIRKRPPDDSLSSESISPSKKSSKHDSSKSDKKEVPTFQLSESRKNKLSAFVFKKVSEGSEDIFNQNVSSEIQTCYPENALGIDFTSVITTAFAAETTSPKQNPEETSEASSSNRQVKHTPLEKQYLELRSQYPDAILLIECGYKYRFFEKDAEIAHKELNLGCFKYHNFKSGIFPVHRLHYYVRRLVYKGYKVGVIKQTESAAVKAAGENRNELFSRKLYALYTKTTFIDGELSLPECDQESDCLDANETANLGSGFLTCIYEEPACKKGIDAVNIAVMAVQVSSGNIFYSSFEDNLSRNTLEGYLLYIRPSEILLPSSLLSKRTEYLLNTFSDESVSRIERLDGKLFDHTLSLSSISKFLSSGSNSSSETQENLQMVLSLPPLVLSCFSGLISYLSCFKLENILKNPKNMKPFLTNEHMVLNAVTLRSLEILSNSQNHSEDGTLFWAMNRTLTRFGERLLRLWLGKPLKDLGKIEERLNILTEIIYSESVVFKLIEKALTKLPDLEKILCSVFYHKCSCHEFVKLIQSLVKVRNEFLALADKITLEIETTRLKKILCKISNLLENTERFISNINVEAAKEEDKINIFRDITSYSSVEACKSKISSIEKELSNLRPHICKILRLPGFKYSTVSGQKYLIEVPNSLLPLVPIDWLKISATKQVSRFRSPEVINLFKNLELHQEKLVECCNEAWHLFLKDFGKGFYKYKKAVSYLAELDCYLSFAKLAKEEKYCRPNIMDTNERTFDIQQGRHPVVIKLMGEESQFVSNDIKLNGKERCIIVTGPNMGGKSTYVRQVALIAVMAHVGCYVPAESATLPLLDGIYVRMGADDDIINKRSTFMSEMCETSEILAHATSNSLVILDELGRGTSTNDGTAIAYATLEYLISNIQCLSLFVTHFPAIVELRNQYAENVIAVHMGYILKNIGKSDGDDIESVTFLYNVVPGVSESSYGINVAALAGISRHILTVAVRKSRILELRMKIHRSIGKLKECYKKEQELSHLQPSTSQTEDSKMT